MIKVYYQPQKRRIIPGQPRGMGDVIEKLAKPIARLLKLPCLDKNGKLRTDSGCHKRKEKMNKLLPFTLAMLLSFTAQATITNVFTGTTTNDGTGDTIRNAFQKLNTNDVYLVSYFTNQVTSMLVSNGWLGPSNSYDILNGKQFYSTLTHCAITGLANIPAATRSAQSELTISNASSSNITFTLLSGMFTADGLRSYVITNGSRSKLWIEAADAMTNAQMRNFW